MPLNNLFSSLFTAYGSPEPRIDIESELENLETEANNLIITLTTELLIEANELQKFSEAKPINNLQDIELLVFGQTSTSKPGNQFFEDGTFSLSSQNNKQHFRNEQVNKFNKSINTVKNTIPTPRKSVLSWPFSLIHQHIIKPYIIYWVIKPKLQKLQALHIVRDEISELKSEKQNTLFSTPNRAKTKSTNLHNILYTVTNMVHAQSTPSPLSTYHEAGRGRTGTFMMEALKLLNKLQTSPTNNDAKDMIELNNHQSYKRS